MQILLKLVVRALLITGGIVLVVYFVRAFDSRGLPALGPEHRIRFSEEFHAGDEDETDWPRYLQFEQDLARELAENIDSGNRPRRFVDRYADGSVTNPAAFDANWNFSYELTAASSRGSAVMLHGLTDSPYSMLSTAQAAVGAGYNVTVPRMPGHGFAVGGLLQARWEDWTAAVRIAVRRADLRRKPGQPLLLVGYSNGGLLAIDYALRCMNDDALPCPDKIILLSPAIAISKVAMLANWHAGLSWIPYFEKFKWLSVLPEVDPFKFTSFPKRAAWEIHKIAVRTHKMLADPELVSKLPPILTFVSLVDNTVNQNAILSVLYSRLPSNGSDLVIYDINRSNTIINLIEPPVNDPMDYFAGQASLNFNVTLLRNRSSDSRSMDIATLAPGTNAFSIERTDLRWPSGVYSLSHIALPFPTFDRLYGDGGNTPDGAFAFGALAPRGEVDVLILPPSFFLRTRNNPFFSFQVRHSNDWLHSTE